MNFQDSCDAEGGRSRPRPGSGFALGRGALVLLLLSLLANMACLRAATVVWTNLTGGNWGDSSNWTPNTVPGPGDDVLIDRGGEYTVLLDVHASVRSLTVGGLVGRQTLIVTSANLSLATNSFVTRQGVVNWSGGTLGGNGATTVLGIFNWSGGNVAGPLSVGVGGVLNITGGTARFLDAPLTNAGSIHWSGSGSLYLRARIVNQAGGVFEIRDDAGLGDYVGNGQASFENAGTFRKSGGNGNTGISVVLNNTGIVEVLRGVLSVNGGYSQSGGRLQFGISSPVNYGRIAFSGTVPLEGALGVDLVGGYQPPLGSLFPVMTYGTASGTFDQFELPPAYHWMISPGAGVLSVGPIFSTQQVNGMVETSPARVASTNGQSVVLNATPHRYHQFLRWTDGNTTNPRSVTFAHESRYAAVFEPALPLEELNLNGVLRTGPIGMPVVLVNGQYHSNRVVPATTGATLLVDLRTSFANGTLFYSTDGSEPSGGETYSGPFNVSAPFAIRAVAFNEDFSQLAEADPVVSLDLSSGGGGVVTKAETSDPFSGLTTVNLTASPWFGWSLMGWSGDGQGSETNLSLPMDGPKSVRATFGTTLTTTGAGLVERSPSLLRYPYGSEVRLTAIPTNRTSYFRQWGGAANGQFVSPLSFRLTNANPIVSAVFFPLPAGNRSLTVRIEGQGLVQRSPAAAFHTNGATVNLTPVPDPDWVFDGWSGDAGGANSPLSLMLDTNKTVTARFRPAGVIDPPVIVSQPSDAERFIGEGIAFTVAVSGSLPLTYQWFKDAPLEAAIGPVLLLANLQSTDAGAYFAVVSNAAGSVTSRWARLTVTSPPNTSPSVALLSPVAENFFRAPTNIMILARATDPDGSVARVDFFANGVLLGSSEDRSTTNTFGFVWMDAPVGTNSVFVRAVDDDGAVTSTLPVEVLVQPPEVTSFRWAQADYTASENDGVIRLKVIKAGAKAGAVSFATRSRTALVDRDYRETAGRLEFAAGEFEKSIEVTLLNEFVADGTKTLEVELRFPSDGAQLGAIASTLVTIADDDLALEHASFLEFIPSASRSAQRGQLKLVLEPATAGGEWRFPWEPVWRASGSIATDLDPGEFPIEFRPLAGFQEPAAARYTVPGDSLVIRTNRYLPSPDRPAGSLLIELAPLDLMPVGAGAPGWRLRGETTYRASGTAIASVPTGRHILEFKPVTGWAAPPAREVTVQAALETVVAAAYLLAGPVPAGTAVPTVLPGYAVLRSGTDLSPIQPYGLSGQIRTPVGLGSGIAVRTRVVLTAAHVLWDEGTLDFVSEVEWFHERFAGEYEPRPLRAAGFYVFEQYAQERRRERLAGLAPGVSGAGSRQWDIAAVYFNEPIARGGQSGYLLSDLDSNEWLASARQKTLIGYPLTGTDEGRMHDLRGGNYTFPFREGRVFHSAGFLSYPGNSGGPFCVAYVRPGDAVPIYFPAGVYLGTAEGRSLVRAIDSDVASLINRAASSAELGTNFLGGGVVGGVLSFAANPFAVGGLLVRFTGTTEGGWRLAGDPGKPFLLAGTRLSLPPGTYRIEFRTVAGLPAPASLEVAVIDRQDTVFEVRYGTQPPLEPATLGVNLRNGGERVEVSLTGTPGGNYVIQRSTDLNVWTSVATNGVPSTFEVLGPGSVGEAFYRAISR